MNVVRRAQIVLCTLVAIAGALILYALTRQPGHLDCELPIAEQVEAQLEAVLNNKALELPIPIVVNGRELRGITEREFEVFFRDAGWEDIRNWDDSSSNSTLGMHPYPRFEDFIAPGRELFIRCFEINAKPGMFKQIVFYPIPQTGTSGGKCTAATLGSQICIGSTVDEVKKVLEGTPFAAEPCEGYAPSARSIVRIPRGVFQYDLTAYAEKISFIRVDLDLQTYTSLARVAEKDEVKKEIRKGFDAATRGG